MARKRVSFRDRMSVQRGDDTARELNRLNHDLRMYQKCLPRMPEQEAFIKGEIEKLKAQKTMLDTKGGV